MLKKKPTKKPEKHDFTALDEAVSELSKQTEALLGSAEPKPAKPKLPKKRSIPHTKGKSFDIIHDPSKKRPLKSSLKTAVAVQHKLITVTDNEELDHMLPEHATTSSSEVTAVEESAQKAPEEVSEPAAESPVIHGHNKGLVVQDSEETVVAEEAVKVLPKEDSKAAASHSAITFEDDSGVEAEPEKAEEVPKPQNSQVESKQEVTTEASTDNSKDEPKDNDETEQEKPAELPAYNSGELFANNLVKESKPRGYKPDENQQKPTVFDTNEYHVELHDWSKLENHSGARWVLLALLILVAGGLGYFVISGQSFPF